MSERDANTAYCERQKRIDDAVSLKKPDRVPSVFFAHYWATRRKGITNRDAMYDRKSAAAAFRDAIVEIEPDAFMPYFITFGRIADLMGYKQVQWPGHNGLAENVSFQYLDKEYMKPEEYDEYLDDPTGWYLAKYLPRCAEAFEPLAELPHFPSLFYLGLLNSAAAFSNPALIAAQKALAEAGAESIRGMGQTVALIAELTELGFPMTGNGIGAAPYDLFSDYYRGSKGAMLDMFRRKDKLLAGMDKALRYMMRPMAGPSGGQPSGIVFIPLHWGLDGFMSPEQFQTFYWPPLRKLALSYIERGLTPCLFWEGDCTSRLEAIKDVPPGKCIYFFERTDVFKAKKVLGDTVCIRGGVPASLLVSGTPAQVSDHCKRLIDEVGRDGGFIMDASVGIPDEARDENVRAMFETTREYGVYS